MSCSSLVSFSFPLAAPLPWHTKHCGHVGFPPSSWAPSFQACDPLLSHTLTKPTAVEWGTNACLHLGEERLAIDRSTQRFKFTIFLPVEFAATSWRSRVLHSTNYHLGRAMASYPANTKCYMDSSSRHLPSGREKHLCGTYTPPTPLTSQIRDQDNCLKTKFTSSEILPSIQLHGAGHLHSALSETTSETLGWDDVWFSLKHPKSHRGKQVISSLLTPSTSTRRAVARTWLFLTSTEVHRGNKNFGNMNFFCMLDLALINWTRGKRLLWYIQTQLERAWNRIYKAD